MPSWPSLPGPDDDSYSFEEQPRHRRAQFGDGYAQRSADGLSNKPRKWSLMWTNLTTAQKDTMRDFLLAQGGATAFDWTPPQESETVLVKGPSWTVDRVTDGIWTMSVELVEVFDYNNIDPNYEFLLLEDGTLLLLEDDIDGTSGIVL